MLAFVCAEKVENLGAVTRSSQKLKNMLLIGKILLRLFEIFRFPAFQSLAKEVFYSS